MADKLTWHRVKPEDQPADPIFFRTIDIKLGTNIIYAGRLAPGAHYEVVRIQSDRGGGKGLKSVDTVHKLNDLVTMKLKHPERFPWREKTYATTFGTMCYSAIWRLG